MKRKADLRSWTVLSSRSLLRAEPWVSVVAQKIRLPDGRTINNYYQIKIPEFVVIYVKTRDNRVVVIRQYKHGIGCVSLTMPGGLINAPENPLTAARRELLEETGYAAENWQSLGNYVPDGNFGCGRAYFFMARNAHKTAEPKSGDLEEMQVALIPETGLFKAVRRGAVISLSSAAIISLAANRRFNPA